MQGVHPERIRRRRLFVFAAPLLLLSLARAQQVQPPPPTPRQDKIPWTLFAPVNRSLPHWIKFSGEWRLRWEEHTGYGFQPGNDDAFFLDRLRLAVDLLPVSWLEAFVQAQDARPWGINPVRVSASNKDLVDIRQFWIEIKAGSDGWARLRLGRQEMRYGQRRLIGSRSWSNAARTFDGGALTLKGNRLQVDVLAVAPVTNKPDGFDNHRPGENLRGIYASLQAVPKATLEPYFLWKTLPDTRNGAGNLLTADTYTTGFRWAGKLPARFDYEIEMARQSGHAGADSVNAWAGVWIAGYSPARIPWSPRVFGEYAYATGDQTPGDGRNNTFDQLYPATHNQHGLADQIGWRNIQHFRAGSEVKPNAKLALDFAFNSFALASRFDALYANDGGVAVKPVKGGARYSDIGRELDVFATYNLNPALTLGAGVGHLYPGQFLKHYTPGGPVTYPYVYTEYRF